MLPSWKQPQTGERFKRHRRCENHLSIPSHKFFWTLSGIIFPSSAFTILTLLTRFPMKSESKKYSKVITSLYNSIPLAIMKFYIAVLALAATVIASPLTEGGRSSVCSKDDVVVCKGNGKSGLISLGQIAPGLLGQSCSGGDVYCCSKKDVKEVCFIESSLRSITNAYQRSVRLASSTLMSMRSAASTTPCKRTKGVVVDAYVHSFYWMAL